ncbi:MAG: glutamate--tRNA ligase family protein, partial [bacterium]|nr:glutamate--tRNA ligase family protein [bacterium]
MTDVRTRIAPSPTGFVHVGSAFGALFNWAFARKNGGSFILRVDDTDRKRHVEEAEAAIYSGLSWLGLDWDEGPDIGGKFGPYRPSEKLEHYQKIAGGLIEKGLAYKEDGAVMFKSPGKDFEWEDAIRGKIAFPASEVKDFVIMKSDGFPVYHFNSVVDDIDMKISHIIRGEEHISNTPRQIALFEALGAEHPVFAHFPTLRNEEHKKLSKRRDPVDLRFYREAGYLPEALVNFLCLFGWSHPEEKDKFSLEEFIDKFTLERVRKSGPIFDTTKLDWLNGQYIRELDDEKLVNYLKEYVASNVSGELLNQIAPLIKERINKFSDVEPLIKFFWETPAVDKELFEDSSKSLLHISTALGVLTNVKDWNLDNINS